MLMLLILSEDLEPCWASMVRVVVESSVSHINAEVELFMIWAYLVWAVAPQGRIFEVYSDPLLQCGRACCVFSGRVDSLQIALRCVLKYYGRGT